MFRRELTIFKFDNREEFFNEYFTTLMNKLNINHYHIYSTTKVTVKERFLRTLNNWLCREFSDQGSYKWLDILQS